MSTQEPSKDIAIVIPENVLESKRILGFRRKNLFEGCILTGITIAIIVSIPFVTRIKIIFIILVGGAVFVLSAVGIKDMSFSELVIAIYNNIKLQKNYHLRSIDKAGKPTKYKIDVNAKYANKSAADKTWDFIKEKIDVLKAK